MGSTRLQALVLTVCLVYVAPEQVASYQSSLHKLQKVPDIVSNINKRIPSSGATFGTFPGPSASPQYSQDTSSANFKAPAPQYGFQVVKSVISHGTPPNYSKTHYPVVDQGKVTENGTRRATPMAQRRIDNGYESYNYVDDDQYQYKQNANYYEDGYDFEDDYKPAAGDNGSSPETKEVPYGGVFGGAFDGTPPASFDPLPPPPGPIKGSVDYILIPLVLIGLAGPIFVVLYVILGAFEAKLAPISRSMNSLSSYKPYLDTLMETVGRSLDKYECLDYVACQVGSLCNLLGVSDDDYFKRTLEPITPNVYKRTMRRLYESISTPTDCNLNKCIKYN